MSPSSLDELMELLEQRDRDGAIELVRRLRSEGVAASQIVRDLLSPAQQQVGALWMSNTWDVAQEHVATGIVDAALAFLGLENQPVPVRGDVVVTCAEGEWHVLPARMLSQLLELRGWRVTFLGASVPAEHLGRFLERRPPVAVAISASLTIHLGGARRLVEASHARGVPALVGGPAFGGDERRARAIGADGWASDEHDADALLDRWEREAPTLACGRDDRSALALEAVTPTVVDDAMAALTKRMPVVAEFDARMRERTAEDFAYILRYTAAALATDDPTILDEFFPWLETVLRARGLPDSTVPVSVRVLLDCLGDGHPEATTLLERVAAPA